MCSLCNNFGLLLTLKILEDFKSMQANKMRQFQLISNPSPPVRWAGMLILLATLTHLAASLRANSGITDPWGENQRPKLYTDYLTQHSGKN